MNNTAFSLKLCSRLNTEIELIPDVDVGDLILISFSEIEEGKLKDHFSVSLTKEEAQDLIELLNLSFELTKNK
jgi:hypothetical protein